MEEKTDLPPPASASSTKLVVNLSVEEEKESLRKYIEAFPIFAFISLLLILNSSLYFVDKNVDKAPELAGSDP